MRTSVDRAISDRIACLRFAMIFGIVILHVPPFVPLAETPEGAFPFIRAFFSHGLFRATVPLLTAISGYLLFSAGLDRRVRELIAKKTRTLLLPLLVWNLPLVATLYVIESRQLLAHPFSAHLYPFDLFTTLDRTFGLVSDPVNYPLNFLRDLFVICLMAPLAGGLLRRTPWLGLAGVSLIFWFDWDGLLVLRETMPISFYLGGLAAVRRWDLTRLDRYAPVCLPVLLALCAAIVAFRMEDIRWFRLVSLVLIWPLGAALVETAFGRLCRRLSPVSFLVFLAHGPLLLVQWLAFQRYLPGAPYALFWLSAPVVVVLVCLAARGLRLALDPARAVPGRWPRWDRVSMPLLPGGEAPAVNLPTDR